VNSQDEQNNIMLVFVWWSNIKINFVVLRVYGSSSITKPTWSTTRTGTSPTAGRPAERVPNPRGRSACEFGTRANSGFGMCIIVG
jgi:hypothetical protein